MTTEEFKKDHPEYTHLEGDDLWDAMSHFKLQQQQGERILSQIEPFWERYTLRWLFYIQQPNLTFGKNNYTAIERCKSCKKGVSSRMGMMYLDTWVSYCPHCNSEYQGEPNTSIPNRLYKALLQLKNGVLRLLDILHILRIGSRYDMFGDEARYVKHWTISLKTGKSSAVLKSRKWWEYLIIKK